MKDNYKLIKKKSYTQMLFILHYICYAFNSHHNINLRLHNLLSLEKLF